MSGEVRLSEAERDEVVSRFYDASTSEEAIETVERILAARLAAVPVPSETGLADRLADLIQTPFECVTVDEDGSHDAVPIEHLRALLSERTATTGVPERVYCWCKNRADGRKHEFLPGRGVGLCGFTATTGGGGS